jgi:hypothetical protein
MAALKAFGTESEWLQGEITCKIFKDLPTTETISIRIKSRAQSRRATPLLVSNFAQVSAQDAVVANIASVEAGPTTQEILIPFDLGLQLLQGTHQEEENLGEMRQIEQEAVRVEEEILKRQGEVQMLQQRLRQWKTLARSRLNELQRDIEFRERIVNGVRNQKNFN